MSTRTLEEQIDVSVSAHVVWEFLHRVEAYPQFVAGLSRARPEGGYRTHLDIDFGGRHSEFDAEITDRGQDRLMMWHTVDGPQLEGGFSLLPIDSGHTRLQVRVKYDPDTVKETFGGPKGFAQASAIERVVREDLQHFKELVEQVPQLSR